MKLFIRFEAEDQEALFAPVREALEGMMAESAKEISLLDNSPADEADIYQLGIIFNASRANQMKDPVNFAYKLCKEHKAECAIGIYDEESGELEEICFFGHEEGRPDIFEIAMYMGL